MAIMGAGALGSLYGGMLAEAGEDVVLIKRSEDHVGAINSRGLQISGVRGDRVIKAKAATDPKTVGQVDLIFFMVKSFHTEEAAMDCLPMVGTDTTILTLQNGVDNAEKIGNVVGREKVMAGSSTHNAVFIKPGHVHHAMEGTTIIGEMNGSITNRARRISQVLNNAGIKTEISSNILGVLWTKLLLAVSVMPLNAVTDLSPAEMIQIPELKDVMTKVVQEAVNVASATGIRFAVEEPISWFLKFDQFKQREYTRGYKASMRQDIERGQKTEIEAFNGLLVRKGKQFGVPTPHNETLLGIIKGIERKSRSLKKQFEN